MSEKIIVSMTSYPKRIGNVSVSIWLLLFKQTMPPDEIHVWLSLEEFPDREKSIPEDLANLNGFMGKVFIHWLPKNTYVHKRHEIFKHVSDDALVFFIDDDVRYDNKLIETVMSTHKKWPNCIICYNQYSKHEYNGRRIIYGAGAPETEPRANYNRWCGQSMIPSRLYPREALTDENQAIRDKCSPISDECWFQPWLVYNDIPIYHLRFGWGDDIDTTNGKSSGLCGSTHAVESNGLERRDNWLHNTISAFPSFIKKYKELFNYG